MHKITHYPTKKRIAHDLKIKLGRGATKEHPLVI